MKAISPLVLILLVTSCGVGSGDSDDASRYDDHLESALTAGGGVGAGCAAGCIWSGFAVAVGAQDATHSCGGTGCACVVLGDARTLCALDGGPAVAEAAGDGPGSDGGSGGRRGRDGQGGLDTGGDPASVVLASHKSGGITLWDQTFGRRDRADPRSNIQDAAAGRAAMRSCYASAPCGSVRLDGRLLAGMRDLIDDYGMSYFVTAIAGAAHSYGSLHYQGRAVDIDEVDGVLIRGDSRQSRALMAACRSLGAVEVYGPSNDPWGHRDHVHCAW